MKILYGSLIFFFYFTKYPIIIYVIVSYTYLDMPNNIIMNILAIISFILILKDWFLPHKKPDNCSKK